MNITMISAIGKNNEIGKDNKLIFHMKEDMKYFKENTINKKIVMGRNTYESIGRPLPKRENIVLTTKEIKDQNLIIMHSIKEVLNYIKENEEIMIIGGEKVYQEFMEYANKLLITKIDKEANADKYFPLIDDSWFLTEEVPMEENNIKYKHLTYKR